jgi:hypothetical protein
VNVDFYRHRSFELGVSLYLAPKEFRTRPCTLAINLGHWTLDLNWRLR